MVSSMKKIFAFPMLWLILGAVAIATEIKTSDLVPAKQQLSEVMTTCLRDAVDHQETAFISAVTTYQSGYIAALAIRKDSMLSAWTKTTKQDIKTELSATAKTYITTITMLIKDLKASQESASMKFKTDVKACKAASLQDLVRTSKIED